jgi:hypothetical protein
LGETTPPGGERKLPQTQKIKKRNIKKGRGEIFIVGGLTVTPRYPGVEGGDREMGGEMFPEILTVSPFPLVTVG